MKKMTQGLKATLGCLAMLTVATQAQAGRSADMMVMVQGPATAETSDALQYYVVASNQGSRNAGNVTATIELPASATFVQADNACSLSGTTLNCNLGRIRRNNNYTLSVELIAPSTAGTITLDASVSTTSRDNNPGNDSASLSTVIEEPVVVQPVVDIDPPELFVMRQCVGSNSLQWEDCTPGSLIEHLVILDTNGVVQTNDPGASGTWNEPDPYHIELNFYDLNNTPMSTFTGKAQTQFCFSGTTVFHQNAAYSGAWYGCIIP
jgi:uncharacterized repeat protein (TIGR01451 family)